MKLSGAVLLMGLVAGLAFSAEAQERQYAQVGAIVTPGWSIVAIGETLDDIIRIEPGASRDDLMVSFTDFEGQAEIRVSNYGSHEPDKDGNIVIRRGPISKYRAVVIDGHAQRAERISDDDEYRYPGVPDPDPNAAPVELMGTETFLFGDDQRRIETAFAAVGRKYQAVTPLRDMLVSYTWVTSSAPKDKTESVSDYVVFSGGPGAKSYTVYLHNDEVEEIYLGIIQWSGWSN